MKLIEIIDLLNPIEIIGNKEMEGLTDIVYDSRKVIEGCVFVCLRGTSFDGHKFAMDAVNKGAKVIISEERLELDGATVLLVKDTRESLALVSNEFFNQPSKELYMIGITGTKGKTTVSCMIKSILENEGHKVGVIGTIGIMFGNELIKSNNTTPESYEIQKYLRKMKENGCDVAVMEVSSIGLKCHRVDGIVFDEGIFTNFSEDHIGGDEHASMEEYLECKSMLFKRCKKGIVNIDDKNVEGILKGHTCEVITYGFDEKADFIASNTLNVSRPGYIGISFDLEYNNGKKENLNVDIPGRFNVYNAMAALAACKEFGASDESIAAGLDKVKVKGRLESVKVDGNYTLLIDYAHNALSMESLLTTLREYKPKRLITLFGAGGNRPKIRRYEMGEVSGRLSDLSVITADNSRYEDVMDIINDIMIGINKSNGKSVIIPDRKEAIKYCIDHAQEGDIIVLAGKGHEDYQEIKGKKYHLDEREVIESIFEKR